VLLADRGNCTFVEKARLAADAGAAGLIVINNGSDCLVMDSGATKEALSSLKGLFVASATNETGADLVRWVGAEVTYAGIKAHILDPASALLLVLALGVLTIAALWSGKSFEDHLKREQQHRRGTEPGAQHLSTAEVDGMFLASALGRHAAGSGGLQAPSMPVCCDRHVHFGLPVAFDDLSPSLAVKSSSIHAFPLQACRRRPCRPQYRSCNEIQSSC
jgi:hypothetical protein